MRQFCVLCGISVEDMPCAKHISYGCILCYVMLNLKHLNNIKSLFYRDKLLGMEDSVKNKLDSLFFTRLFVPERHK